MLPHGVLWKQRTYDQSWRYTSGGDVEDAEDAEDGDVGQVLTGDFGIWKTLPAIMFIDYLCISIRIHSTRQASLWSADQTRWLEWL
jgi:hypothetical protein